MTVRTEQEGPILVVTIDRPEARNAVDRPTAQRLADAFRAFDADDELAVAVLTGADGTFCAGADLKAVATGRGNRVEADLALDGPLGPTRMLLSKPVMLARQLSAFPQRALRSDRLSSYHQWEADLDRAMAFETEVGRATVATGETVAGAARFTAGEGRHGTFA